MLRSNSTNAVNCQAAIAPARDTHDHACPLQIVRQVSDAQWAADLLWLRLHAPTYDVLRRLKSSVVKHVDAVIPEAAVILTGTNDTARHYNIEQLQRYSGTSPVILYAPVEQFDGRLTDADKQHVREKLTAIDHLAPLHLAVGCPALLVRNTRDPAVHNGVEAAVVRLDTDTITLRLHSTGEQRTVTRVRTVVTAGGAKVTLSQFPVLCNYARTVHR